MNEKLQIKISGDAHTVPIIFLLNTLKGTVITLPAVILYFSTLSSTNRQILTPKRYDEHPRHCYRGFPPGVFISSTFVEKNNLFTVSLKGATS